MKLAFDLTAHCTFFCNLPERRHRKHCRYGIRTIPNHNNTLTYLTTIYLTSPYLSAISPLFKMPVLRRYCRVSKYTCDKPRPPTPPPPFSASHTHQTIHFTSLHFTWNITNAIQQKNKNRVLEVRIYLDNPAHLHTWLLSPRYNILPRIFQSIRPLVLPKLKEERERGSGGKGKNAKPVNDVVVEGLHSYLFPRNVWGLGEG